MPVVIGQPMVAPCFLATRLRISLIVISLPAGTRFMMASTSRGAGMATVPRPQRLDILPVIGTTLGRSLLSASFSRQDLRLAMALLQLSQPLIHQAEPGCQRRISPFPGTAASPVKRLYAPSWTLHGI